MAHKKSCSILPPSRWQLMRNKAMQVMYESELKSKKVAKKAKENTH